MHGLSELKIENYKSCREIDFILSDFTPLVGYNNGGKSNILESIKWLLKSSVLVKEDFFDPSQPIVVMGKIVGITDDILENLIEKHRNRIEPYLNNGCLYIRRKQPNPGGAAKNISLEIRNPAIEDEQADNAWEPNPTGIDQAIKAIFPEPIEIGAMENATEDVGKSKAGTTIGKLIAEIMAPIEQAHGVALNEALEGIKCRLEAEGPERAQELNDFDLHANNKLKDLFPGLQVRLHVPAPEIKELFKSGTIKIIEDGLDICRDVQALGHGAQRSIQMALVRYLADIKSEGNQNPTRTLLLIDEPELYLHPQAIEHVRLALKTLSQEGYQVIFTTHSPLMISTIDIGTTIIIRKNDNNESYSEKRLADAINEVIEDAPSQTQTLFELSNSSQILFSNNVVVAEGRTEQRLLPEIYHLIHDTTLSADKTALVSPGGAGNTSKCLNILSAMEIPAKAVVDLDYAFRGAVSSSLLDEDDEDIHACRALFTNLAQNHNFNLAEDGFPRKGGEKTPAEAFVILASEPAAEEHIANLHAKLLNHNIWLWKKGAIEEYLGIGGKNERAWAAFKVQLHQNGCEATLNDFEGTRELIEWIKG
ncbi:MAG: AAA family ATPase [Thermodesulfobacteriota bacterium]|nr:AAA family ATPase [Thermodesulfobacteriota bacterium]